MAKDATEFTMSIIAKSLNEQRLRESKKLKKLRESKKSLKESKSVLKEEEDLDEEEIDEEVLDVEEPQEEVVDATMVEDGDNYEESPEDGVYFCTTCNKYFIATKDTPDEEIACPICNEKEMLIDVGSADDALEDPENEEVSDQLEGEKNAEEALEAPEEDVENEEDVDLEECVDIEVSDDEVKVSVDGGEDKKPELAEDEYALEEGALEEGLRILAKRHISENAKLRLVGGRISKVTGNAVLEGRMLPQKKSFKVVLEGFKENVKSGKKSFVVEGTCSLFKNSKFKMYVVKEGKSYTIKRFGYGFLKESAKAGNYRKITGIIG